MQHNTQKGFKKIIIFETVLSFYETRFLFNGLIGTDISKDLML